jgi:hypothetical protein
MAVEHRLMKLNATLHTHKETTNMQNYLSGVIKTLEDLLKEVKEQ